MLWAIYHGWFGLGKKERLLTILPRTLLTLFVLTIFFIVFGASIQSRLSILVNPEQDKFGKGFQYCIIRDIISEAVFFGKGNIHEFLQNISKFSYTNSDYLLVI